MTSQCSRTAQLIIVMMKGVGYMVNLILKFYAQLKFGFRCTCCVLHELFSLLQQLINYVILPSSSFWVSNRSFLFSSGSNNKISFYNVQSFPRIEASLSFIFIICTSQHRAVDVRTSIFVHCQLVGYTYSNRHHLLQFITLYFNLTFYRRLLIEIFFIASLSSCYLCYLFLYFCSLH